MQAGRSVGAKCDIAIDDAVTHADVLDVFANGFDHPGGLVADDRWKGRDRKSTSTIINVDEVETYDGVADQCFIVARLTHDDVLEPQDFGRTIFVNTGGSRGGWHDISPFKAPEIIVRLLAERRECYLAVGGGWSRPAGIAPRRRTGRGGVLSLMRCPLADETDACSSNRCLKRPPPNLATVRKPLRTSRAVPSKLSA